MSIAASSPRAAALSAGAGLALVVTAGVVWRWTYSDIDVEFPPLHATWDPRLGLLTLPAIAIGLALWLGLPRLAERLSWPALLLTAFASTWIWTMALAMTEGKDGLARVFERRQEYVYDAQHVTSISHMMHTFIDRIPFDSPHNWYVHVAGHPPGSLLFFVLLDRLGVTGFFSIGLVVVTIGSTAIVAVLITLRTLGSVQLARGAMPWIVLAPSAVWMGVTGDAMFTAVAAWGLALLAIAATSTGRRRIVTAVGAGLLLGLCVYLSYGLVLLGFLAVAVLLIARTWRPLPWALGGSAIVVAAFTAAGFSWWKAYPVLVQRYNDGIASNRPYDYWVWADIAAWTFTAGLAVWAAFPAASRAFRERNVVAQLAAAALLTIGFAAISGMSKAETERIFLPFTIWIVALPMLLPARWHRPLLLSQAVIGLGVEQLLLTRW
ncbi:MAG: methylthioxylose transferase [Nocardioidaceae bacterium]|nr:methylthioxylose transferase [Nocardioidaceae bacterium]